MAMADLQGDQRLGHRGRFGKARDAVRAQGRQMAHRGRYLELRRHGRCCPHPVRLDAQGSGT